MSAQRENMLEADQKRRKIDAGSVVISPFARSATDRVDCRGDKRRKTLLAAFAYSNRQVLVAREEGSRQLAMGF